MKKLIKNYTTEVPLERTIIEIQALLANNDATGIMFEYDGQGKIKDVFFRIRYNDRDLPFRLPAKPQAVFDALFAKTQYAHIKEYREKYLKKAEQIAWRICKLWLEAQITHINLDQAKPQEVFLPYLVMPNNKTLYEVMEEHKFLLPSGDKEQQP
jgi:hypothetical protein